MARDRERARVWERGREREREEKSAREREREREGERERARERESNAVARARNVQLFIGLLYHHDDKVDSDQQVVNKELSLWYLPFLPAADACAIECGRMWRNTSAGTRPVSF